MKKRCAICDEQIEEDSGKLKGTLIKVKDEKRKEQAIYVCFVCQKKDDWMETAIIRGA
jgi:hypothetical protein